MPRGAIQERNSFSLKLSGEPSELVKTVSGRTTTMMTNTVSRFLQDRAPTRASSSVSAARMMNRTEISRVG